MSAIEVRAARADECRLLAKQLAEVAEERDGIATEPPVDIDARTRAFEAHVDGTLVALVDGNIVGSLHVEPGRFGTGELGMSVLRPFRGRGVGSALLAAAIEKAREDGLHKLSLEVFPHNESAIALYRKFGFVEEGRRRRQIRRQSGEIWDTLVMGLLL